MRALARSSSVFAVLLGLAALVLPARYAQASGEPLLFECPGCNPVQLESMLSVLGNGDRYLIDLDGRSMRKFQVSGLPATPFSTDGQSRSSLSVTCW